MDQLELNLAVQQDVFYTYSAAVVVMQTRQILGWSVRCRYELTEGEEAKLLQEQDDKLQSYVNYDKLESSSIRQVTKEFVDATGLIPGNKIPYCHKATHI